VAEHSESGHKLRDSWHLGGDHLFSAQAFTSSQGASREQPPHSNIAPSEHERPVQAAGDLGQSEEDLGFFGQMSEISWIYSTTRLLIGVHTTDLRDSQEVVSRDSIHAKDLSYFMDQSDLHAIKGDSVNARNWPSIETSILLAEAYFHAVPGTFPFMHKPSFFHILTNFPRNKPVLSLSERRWLTVANLIWAVGTKWLQLTNLNRFAESHELYYARARALGLDHMVLVEKPDIEMIRAIGLLAFYQFINGSIDR
jgi:hypothetical protein